jgi:hypothetical protein
VNAPSHPATVFLISPASLKGQRGQAVLHPKGGSELSARLQTPAGAPIAAVFTFVSSLYFRGKAAYAKAFGRAPSGLPPAYVITAGGGLVGLDELVTIERLRGWAGVAVREDNPHFTQPLQRHAAGVLAAHDEEARFVLLGSVASHKYSVPLLEVLGERLLFPPALAGLGDMARGSLLLKAVSEQRELEYAPVAGQAARRRSEVG